MSYKLPNNTEASLLGAFIGLLSVSSIFLYFTGYTYRWAYYNFFQLQIQTLELPLESFFIVPIQVFLGSWFIFIRTIFVFIGIYLLIKLTIYIIEPKRNNSKKLTIYIIEPRSKQVVNRNNKCNRLCDLFLKIGASLQRDFPKVLRRDVIIVSWILIALFVLAKYQGTEDARRDATYNSSFLPAVTFISAGKQKLALGRNLSDITLNTSEEELQSFRIIGDMSLYEYIKNQEITDTRMYSSRIWRLLLKRNGWIYLFQATLDGKSKPNTRIPVLAIRESANGDQMLILSPEPIKIKRNN